MTSVVAPTAARKTLGRLAGLALLAALIATAALIWLALAEPAEPTTRYDSLGRIAAVGGIASGLLFGAAAGWAAIKGLWEHVPMWVRVAATALIAIFLIAGGATGSGS